MKQLKWIYITPLLFLTGCASSFNVGDSGKLSCRQSAKGIRPFPAPWAAAGQGASGARAMG